MERVGRSEMHVFDVAQTGVRALNSYLHGSLADGTIIEVQNPGGAHSIAVGARANVRIEVRGHAGYYVGGMNQSAAITVHGNVGWGVAENMMSGSVRVTGFASEAAGATAHGGLLVIEGDASLRCGISLKGADIVVGGSVGSFSAFMAQKGRILICGDAGDALGDSLYEAVIYVGGKIRSLGADAQEEPMGAGDFAAVRELLAVAGMSGEPGGFKRVASKRGLYHWNAECGWGD